MESILVLIVAVVCLDIATFLWGFDNTVCWLLHCLTLYLTRKAC